MNSIVDSMTLSEYSDIEVKIWKGDIDLWTAYAYQSDWLNTLLIINFLDIC